jgi:uncharacterized membrane protein (DUF373 family)
MPGQIPAHTAEEKTRIRPYVYLGQVEIVVYSLLGILLSATGFLAVAGALHVLGSGIRDWTGTDAIFELIDRLLLVLMLVELLHTVRISIRSHILVIEPFLIVGLIATIRRTLVLTLQAEGFTKNTQWGANVESQFRAAMIELGLLAVMIAVFVASIYVIRGTPPEEDASTASQSGNQ